MRARAVSARQCRLLDLHPALLGNAVDRQETQVVRCELILDARISKPDDQLHALPSFPVSP